MGAVNNLDQNDVGVLIKVRTEDSVSEKRPTSRRRPMAGAYLALLLFILIYCARPEDWIPGLSHVPLAKIAGTIAFLALLFSLRYIKRIPREVVYLALLIG